LATRLTSEPGTGRTQKPAEGAQGRTELGLRADEMLKEVAPCLTLDCSRLFSMKSSPNFTKLYLRATNQKTPAPNLLLAGNPACDQD
jgi:hypothetical protein